MEIIFEWIYCQEEDMKGFFLFEYYAFMLSIVRGIMEYYITGMDDFISHSDIWGRCYYLAFKETDMEEDFQ